MVMTHGTPGRGDFQLDSCGPGKRTPLEDEDDELHFDMGAWADARQAEELRSRAFRMPSFPVDYAATLTAQTRRRADVLFERMRRDGLVGGYKLEAKRLSLHYVYHALLRAHYHGACVMFPRNEKAPDFSELRLQVVDAVVGAGLAREERSRPGRSPHMSRLIPSDSLADAAPVDPWTFDPHPVERLVYLYRRGDDKEEIAFDPDHPVAREVQVRLGRVNRVNAQYEITYEMDDEWGTGETRLQRTRVLRPVHYAVFTDDFEHHGRIYTGRYGHQGLKKAERGTIRFNGAPSVELDYSGLHPRLAYHLEGVDYREDPYRLWGQDTTPPMRLMAKVMVNALLNAPDRAAAVSSCNLAMSVYTSTGQHKSGKALSDAVALRKAAKQSGLTFKGILPAALRRHARIAHHFGSDAGMRLMRVDSRIALRVLHHFATRAVPCLGVHDSFIVPRAHEATLRRVMLRAYEREVGHLPVVQGG
jgi:hypothetical protein